jgi:hypothetical protein
MIDNDEIDILLCAAMVLKHKGYDKLATTVTAVTIIEKVDEYMLDDFD